MTCTWPRWSIMRLVRLMPLLGFVAVAIPLHAAAGSTMGARLVLSPAQGGLGSRFTATFTYSVPVCNKYQVELIWDPSTPDVIGTAQPTNSDQNCQVTIPAAVPSNAHPGTTYTVLAAAHPATPSGTGVWSSSDPQGTATYEVTQPPPSTASPSPSQSAQSAARATASSQPVAFASPQSSAVESASSSSSSDGASGASTSGPASSGAQFATGGSPPTALATSQPRISGWVVAIVAVAAALLLGLALTWRAGWLRLPLRHR
jgi:hypothetical protein